MIFDILFGCSCIFTSHNKMSGWNMIPLYVIKYFKDKKVLEILFNYSCRGYPFSFEKSSFLFHLSAISDA